MSDSHPHRSEGHRGAALQLLPRALYYCGPKVEGGCKQFFRGSWGSSSAIAACLIRFVLNTRGLLVILAL